MGANNNGKIQEENSPKVKVHERKKSALNRLTEIYLWFAIALLAAGRPIYSTFRNSGQLYPEEFLSFYNEILLAIFVFLFPFLFEQIFGKLPLEFMRTKRQTGQEIQISGSDNTIIINDKKEIEIKEEEPLQRYIRESKEISEKIYSRSGVYLLIGCLIAFIGVAIFYSPIFGKISSTDKELSELFLEFLPRFGALFFIEFVAFFFLKQYRIMMQEFRYYEKIKRNRQNKYAVLQLLRESKGEPEFAEMIMKVLSLPQDEISKLSGGETTELLELEKTTQKELDIMSKFTELLKEIKK